MYLYIKLKNQNGTIAKLAKSKYKNKLFKNFAYFMLDQEVPAILQKDYLEDELPKIKENVETYDELYEQLKIHSKYLSKYEIVGIKPCGLKLIDDCVYIKCLYSTNELYNKFKNSECMVTMNLPKVVEEWVNHPERDNDDIRNAKNAIKNIVPKAILILE